MAAYYNENDPYAAQWLRNLIKAGHIAAGDVDERSIVDVRSGDLKGCIQCHFFAGIGGWSRALRLAGWPDDRPVWTGSCPCQPFSAAGKGKAADDERHLWPAWASLVRECCPRTILGEQVEAAIGWGWLDLVFNDLEAEGYACGAAVLPACSVGAPHIRQRLWFVADTTEPRYYDARQHDGRPSSLSARSAKYEGRETDGRISPLANGYGSPRRAGRASQVGDGRGQAWVEPARLCDVGELGVTEGQRYKGVPLSDARKPTNRITETNFWHDLEWIPCTDGKARPVKPGIFPLAHGVSARMGKLRAAGNAIVPQVAAEFIKAAMSIE